MADDLCRGCQMSEYSSYHDASWALKYMDMHWKVPVSRNEDMSATDY